MISVIIPAYNEEKRIEPTVLAIYDFLKENRASFEIIVVDDGSVDKTSEVVKKLENEQIKLLSYAENRGKGGAVKYGVEHALGDMVVFTDADLPYLPQNILKAKKMLTDGCDVVLGSRMEQKNGKGYPLHRKIMSGCFGFFVTLLLHLKEKDTQCGFKAFTKEAANAIFQRARLSGWGFDVELIFIAQKLGLKIKRLEVTLFHDCEGSKVRIFKDPFQMLREVFLIQQNDKKDLYR